MTNTLLGIALWATSSIVYLIRNECESSSLIVRKMAHKPEQVKEGSFAEESQILKSV